MIIYETEKDIGGTILEDILMNRLDKFIKPFNNDFFGLEYHVSVTLYDKTFLPCVVFRHLGKTIELKFNSLHEKVYREKLLPQDNLQKEIIESVIAFKTIRNHLRNLLNLREFIKKAFLKIRKDTIICENPCNLRET